MARLGKRGAGAFGRALACAWLLCRLGDGRAWAAGGSESDLPAGSPSSSAPASTADGDADFLKGLDLMDLGRHADAAAFFERVLTADPTAVRAHYYVAKCRLAAGEPERALPSLDAYEASPDLGEREKADITLLRARALHDLGRDAEAVLALDAYVALPVTEPAREAARELRARWAAPTDGGAGAAPVEPGVGNSGAGDGPAPSGAAKLTKRRSAAVPALFSSGAAFTAAGVALIAVPAALADDKLARYNAGEISVTEYGAARDEAAVLAPAGAALAGAGSGLLVAGILAAVRERGREAPVAVILTPQGFALCLVR